MKLILQKLREIYWYRYRISDHLMSIPNVSKESDMYSPLHFGPKRSPDTFHLEHSLVRNGLLKVGDFHVNLENLLQNAVFEVILRASDIFSTLSGSFRTKECSQRKVSGDLFDPKCDGEYISDSFEAFVSDIRWSETPYWYQ